MRKLLTIIAVLGPCASSVLGTCDPPGPPATQPSYPSCASYGVTIPSAGYDNTGGIYWWSCCDADQICLSYAGGSAGHYPQRFHRCFYLYSDGSYECYDKGHTYRQDDGSYGCCLPGNLDLGGDS